MPVNTNILPVKTKCSYQLPISSLHIAPTAHQVRDAQVCALNVFILNRSLVARNFAKFVAKFPKVHASLRP